MAQVVFLRHLNQGDRVQFEAIPSGFVAEKVTKKQSFLLLL